MTARLLAVSRINLRPSADFPRTPRGTLGLIHTYHLPWFHIAKPRSERGAVPIPG